MLAATLASVGTMPVASIALILGVDRFMSEARALTNLIGNGVATIVVAKWEGALDTDRMHRHLNNETDAEADNPEAVLVEEEEIAGIGTGRGTRAPAGTGLIGQFAFAAGCRVGIRRCGSGQGSAQGKQRGVPGHVR